jgi:hypothetical protein
MPEYTFDAMIASLHSSMRQFPDTRTGKNTQYEVMDAAVGAFSVFFTQCPSFLSHQKLMQERYGLSNAKTLFGMKDIPSDNQIRNLLDQVPPVSLSSVFQDCFQALQTSHHLDTFRVAIEKGKKQLLIALDGTQYFQSDTISCRNCSTKVKDGKEFSSHTVVTPTIVAPGVNKVISLMPEYITSQDGDKKQDCELKASKRWLKTNGNMYGKEAVTILGDDLYAHEPFAQELLGKGLNFIFVCKPDSHKTVYEWVKGITKEKIEDRFDGKKHLIYTYKYAEGVALKDAKDSLLVNFVEVIVTERITKKQLYHNAFITNHPLTDETLPAIVDCGRARWKIENENNNTLKRQGYNLEHNFGHGKKYLASLLATMNILAFLFHTILEFMNEKYQWLREVSGARKRLFESIRVLLIYIPATNFDHFLTFMIESLKHPRPIETLKFPV